MDKKKRIVWTPSSLAVEKTIKEYAEREGLQICVVVQLIMQDVYRGRLKYKDGSTFFKEGEQA